jgi:type II secretory pathway pseudopilin PulG
MKNFHGFTLVEIAITLLIVTLLLGGLVPTISSQVEQRNLNDTRKQLDEIQQALLGYAVSYGRLPCPAMNSGTESFASGGNAANGKCSNFYNGYVPAATLGLNGLDAQGFLNDAWGNRLRYAVSSWSSASFGVNNVFTSANGMSIVGISNLTPNLLVCASATGVSSTSCGAGNSLTPNGAAAIIYSTGKNGGYGGSGTDEAENPNPNSTNNNLIFISHPPTNNAATNGEFDDIVIWLSGYALINRMVAAGQLP